MNSRESEAERLQRETLEKLNRQSTPMTAPTPDVALAKAMKLLEALCQPHEVCEADGEHAWRECRTCLAREELEYDSSVPLFQAILAALKEKQR